MDSYKYFSKNSKNSLICIKYSSKNSINHFINSLNYFFKNPKISSLNFTYSSENNSKNFITYSISKDTLLREKGSTIKLRLPPVAKPTSTATVIEYDFLDKSLFNKSRTDIQCLCKSLLKKPNNNDLVILVTY